ncbi:endolytic transglycosylase MltG [Patescibacteria group bacterium]|nr:endolytic transglycosylase MltG [Patescibacteria group bacterium]
MHKKLEYYKGILMDKASWYVSKVDSILPEHADRRVLCFIIIVLLSLGLMYFFVASAPNKFPERSITTIEEGESIASAALQLKEDEFIRSKFVFQILVVLKNRNRGVLAGDYYFHDKEGLFAVVSMLTNGNFGLDPVRITVFEGETRKEMADSYEDKFNKFDVEKFLEITKDKEGYLFPDTYFFLPSVRAKEVAKTMEKNFIKKIDSLETEILKHGKSLEDVIIMASLIEKESADSLSERRLISGILWERLELGIALQVDATFKYVNGKSTFKLSTDDLKIDSPYNTYTRRGLPVGPIANPGLDSILAAVTPTKSDYLYYLHDREGGVHYAETFDEHKDNKTRYLR